MALCHITGIFTLPSGELAKMRQVRLVRKPREVFPGGGGTVIPDHILAITDNAGYIDLTALDGEYTGWVRSNGVDVAFRFVVPDQAEASFEECIGGEPPVPVAPVVTVQPSLTVVGNNVVLAIGSATGVPMPRATWTLEFNGVDITSQVVDMRVPVQLGNFELFVVWSSSSGFVNADESLTISEDMPEVINAPSISPATAAVGDEFTIVPGVYSSLPAVVRKLTLDGVDVTGQINSSGKYVARSVGTISYEEVATNSAGSVSASASATSTAIDFGARYAAQSLVYVGSQEAASWSGGSMAARGSRAVTYTVAGTGAAITADASGFTFTAGQYFASSPSGTPAYERLVILMDLTVSATSGSAAYVVSTANSRMFLNMNANGDVIGQGPNNVNVAIGARVAEIGERRCVAFVVDRTGLTTGSSGNMMQINADGFATYGNATMPTADIGLNNMRIGSAASITVHRMAIFGASTGQQFVATPQKLWQDFASKTLPTFSDEWEVWATTGHSLNACRTLEAGLSNSSFTRLDRGGVKMISGLVNGNSQPIALEGPGWGVINTAIPETGYIPAEVSGNVTIPYSAAVARSLSAVNQGQTPPRIMVMSTGAGGAEAGQLDDDPNTGVDNSVVIYGNATAQAASAGRILAGKTVTRRVNCLSIGTSDRTDPPGVYAADIHRALNQHRDLQAAQWPTARLHEVIYQSPGSKNTSQVTDFWERVIMAEYNEAEARGAHLIPLYPYGADGLNDHPNAEQGTLYGEVAAWAIDWVEQGKRWTIAQPEISRAGGVFTLTYPTLNADEEFEFTPDSWYAIPPANKGFEVLGGGSITNVELDGNKIILTTTGTVNTLRYANQRQNVVGQIHFGFRGLVRTTARRACIRFPTQQLYRHLPAFQIEVTP